MCHRFSENMRVHIDVKCGCFGKHLTEGWVETEGGMLRRVSRRFEGNPITLLSTMATATPHVYYLPCKTWRLLMFAKVYFVQWRPTILQKH